ncbi:MAG TPA: 50S ribosomal protein P1 [archaeon]|nr:50S ribosomal protein P1 [archaeon]
MNLVYGALLLHSAGKPINEANVKKVAEAAGEKVEEAQIKALVAALEGVNIEDAISKAAMPVAAAAPAAVAGEAKKEEKKEEDDAKKAEEAAAGLGALFG